jgi:hypothetical protein
MKKIFRFLVSMFVVLLIALPAFSATDMMPSKNHAGYIGKDGKAWYKAYIDYLYLTGGTGYQFLFTGTPSADRTYTLPDKSGTIAMTSDVDTTAPAINDVTGAAADVTIAFTAYQGTFTSTLTNKDMFTFQGLGAFGDVSVMRIEQKTGNATDGTVLEVVSADANVDPLVVSSSAQAGVLTVGQGGTVDIIGATTITGAFTETGAATLGNGTAGVAINSSVWDITAAGAMSGLTTLSLTDSISLANGKAVRPSVTTAETMAIQSYDVDGGAYVNSILLTNGNTPAVAVGSGVETVAINSSDWDISTTGAMTGIGAITADGLITGTGGSTLTGTVALGGGGADTVAIDTSSWDVSTAGAFTGVADITGTAGAALGITLASDGAADDLTISVTGANDSSVILNSAGTGADAIGIHATAGGIDIDSASTSAAAIDIDATGTVAGNAITVNTTDGGILLQTGGAANGDLTMTVGDAVAINATGTAAITSSDWGISTAGALTKIASVSFDNSAVIYNTTVACNNACIKGLHAAPLELVAAPGADKFIELKSAVIIMNYGTNILTESSDDLVIEYETGTDITAAIDSTGFLDQAGDILKIVEPSAAVVITAANAVNKNIRLFNTGDGELAGNAGNDTTLSIRVSYTVHTAGL